MNTADPGLAALFAAAAEARPDHVALVTSAGEVRYGELLDEVRAMAGRLHDAGVRPRDRVMVGLDRGHGYIVVVMALLMLGASAVPVDPGEPEARTAALRALVEPRLVIGASPPLARGSGYLQVDDERELPRSGTDSPFPGKEDLDSEAIVFSTSGSTGTPKAVAVCARAVLAGAAFCRERFGFGPEDVHVFKTAVSFTSVLRQVIWPLVTGGRVVVLAPDRSRDLLHLGRLMAEQQVTVSSFFPSHLGVLMRRDLPASLRCLMLGGEPVTVGFCSSLRARTSARILNVYGMTECNIISTYDLEGVTGEPSELVPLASAGAEGLSLRRPDLSVVGEDDADAGEGELFVDSEQTASGYPGMAQEAAARFPVDPATGRGLLRTGDLVEARDGRLYFKGRVDKRVKIRGYSVDPSAVEQCLVSDVGVAGAVVFKVDHGVSDQRLDAAVVRQPDDARTADLLLEALRARLPEYMVPTRIHLLSSLPTTGTGKVDVQAVIREFDRAGGSDA